VELLQSHSPDRRTHLLKTTRDQLNIIDAFHQLGSYRAAARLCGTTHKTVKKVVERHEAGGPWVRRPRPTSRNTDRVMSVIWERVRRSDGRISAKRLMPAARAAGYKGSARNLRRAVAKVKAEWRQKRRIFRPWVPSPGQHLVVDWTKVAVGLHMFCVVLAWSRYRFVRFASDETRETTLALMAECFEELGAVPAVALTDRMACLKNGVVANVVVPHPDYVRFAAHYGFRPDFCEAADPESKGVVEHLCGYAQRDLVVPEDNFGGDIASGNRQAKLWGLEVNGRVHSETQATPDERLAEERALMRPLPSLRPALCRGELRKVDRMQTIRFGSLFAADRLGRQADRGHRARPRGGARLRRKRDRKASAQWHRARSLLRTSTTRAGRGCRREPYGFGPGPSARSLRSVLPPMPSCAPRRQSEHRDWQPSSPTS
jgi:transposase